MVTLVIEVTQFDSEAINDLRGCLEAGMASEVHNMAVTGNMHMDSMVINDPDFKSEVKFDF